MKNLDIIDGMLSPFSKWINRNFLGDKKDRSICQRVEDNFGIPKIATEIGIMIGIVAMINRFKSR